MVTGGGEVEFGARDQRSELTSAEEEQVVPIRIPGRRVRVEKGIRHPPHLVVYPAPHEHPRHPVLLRHAEREEIAARRPLIIAHLPAMGLRDQCQLAVIDRNHPHLAVLVAKRDALAVRRPLGRITKTLPAGSDLLSRLQSILPGDPHLLFAALIRDERDSRTIWRPARPLLVPP